MKRGITALLALGLMVTTSCSVCPRDSHGNFDVRVLESVVDSCCEFHDSQRHWPSPDEIRPVLVEHLQSVTPGAEFRDLTIEPGESGGLRVDYSVTAERGCFQSSHQIDFPGQEAGCKFQVVR